MSKHYVVYIPGLGDHRARGQELAVGLWRLYGVHGEVFRIYWADGKPFSPKLERLLARIDALHTDGNTVSLVAASAGASAALAAYAARKDVIAGVVLLCGKVHNPHKMHHSVFGNNVSFAHSMDTVSASLAQLNASDRAHILSAHPLADESVPVADTIILGAQERTLPVIGHFFGIAYGLTVYAPIALRFLKQQVKLQRST